MKNLMKACVLSVAMLVLMCGVAGADNFYPQGSTLVPNLVFQQHDGSNFFNQYMTITNITDKPVKCRVSVYNHDGLDITSLGKYYTGSSPSSYGTVISSGSGDIDIPAHSTRLFALDGANTTFVIYGYAVIEWNSSDPQMRKALIAGRWSLRVSNGQHSCGQFSINNDQPF